ncbi:MAG TPA: BatD family protein [Moheibacter sp.]|nr:BatD family protein [Moheibacter sp.]
MLRILYTYLLILFASIPLNAQKITFEAEVNKTEVSVNERFFVQFLLTSQEKIHSDEPMDLPNFGGLQHLGTSQINRVQYDNGKMTQLFGVEAVLVAEQEGEFTIAPAVLKINGKTYRTQAIKVKVSKGLKPEVRGGQRIQGAFITTEISEPNPYLNQEIILVVKAYVRDYALLHRLRNFQEPDFSNVVAKFVSEKVQDHEKQVLINGQTFIAKELARYILFPQKSGELLIDPFSIDVLISGYYGAEAVSLSSDPLRLNVKNLPSGKPKNFQGAVGEFTMNTTLSKNKAKQEESLHMEVEIIGSGNLNTLQMPEIDLPEHLEAYAPKKRNAFEARPSGLKGKIVENIILVPQYGGNYKISPISFSYFDPEKAKYVTLKSKPFHLEVEGESPPVVDSTQLLSHLDQMNTVEDTATQVKTSILPKKLKEARTQVVESVSTNYTHWLGALLGLLLLIGLFFGFRKKKQTSKQRELTSSQVQKQFQGEVQQALKTLKTMAKDQDAVAFLSLEENILTTIGRHYAGMQLADFTTESAHAQLKKMDADLAEKWKDMLLNCKQAKYAFSGESVDLTEKYARLESFWKLIARRKVE